ncbi:MAG: glycosyltransferase family 4 protein [Acidimicrobiaceae bacterium]|nr:glycosyltransferase family 4 protein [Acidimicrobiaceae bacterium]
MTDKTASRSSSEVGFAGSAGIVSVMAKCAFVSFRLGMADGVSVVARNWGRAVEQLGFEVITVAGEGPVDRTVPGLAIAATDPPSSAELIEALADADLVVVENLCTIPLNLPAARATAAVLRGRPTIMHHHDPPWQRERFAHISELPIDDADWRHVTINLSTKKQMQKRGFAATCIYNGFATATGAGDRSGVRRRLGVGESDLLIAHPVRAVPRKNVARAVALCEQLGGAYWLWGPAEEGYDDELARLLRSASCRVVHGTNGESAVDLYRAADAVVFPSTWEGFGNPPVEASIHRVPVAVADYPVAGELRALGFEWYPTDDPEPLRTALRVGDDARIERNRRVAVKHLSLPVMTEAIAALLAAAGWLP